MKFSLMFASILCLASACQTGDKIIRDDASLGRRDGGALADARQIVSPLEGVGTVTKIVTLPTPAGGNNPFTEGPLWDPNQSVLLFTDIPNSTIFSLTLPDQVTEFRKPSEQANGLAWDPNGNLLAAEHQGRRISRTDTNGVIESVAGTFEGNQFHSPNDLAVAQDGTIYFTDPPYGGNAAELDFNGLFRRATDGTITAEVRYPVAARPNGVGLSNDESTLYLADTTGKLLAYDVQADGSLSGERTLNDSLVNGADGMVLDRDGNIWLTTEDGIDVFSPSGDHWGTVAVPERPSNCTFGTSDGGVLFITAQSSLYQLDVSIPGRGF